MWRSIALLLLATAAFAVYASTSSHFEFAILGDRTGATVPGVYTQVWRDVAAHHPDFVITVGDTIQGGNDSTVGEEWRKVLAQIAPYCNRPLFFTPGNHDIWSAASAQAFQRYTKHPLHYSFDYNGAHFTVLDNSRTDNLPASELEFLQQDLEQHKAQSPKFVFSHRPSWILQLVLSNPNFPLHQIAKRYGVNYIIAGHIHQMLRFQLDGINYLSMGSSGGHLRERKEYRNGWFFGYSLVTVNQGAMRFEINELGPPFGQARRTSPSDWGPAGLAR